MIPLQVYFSRWRHTRLVAERIARLNPEGIEEGCIPYGWNPKRTFRASSILMDIVSVHEFRQMWGDGALMLLRHKKRLVNLGGKRRAVTGLDFNFPFH